MRVWAYASRPQYAEHLAPIFDALPAADRAAFRAPRNQPWGTPGLIDPGDPVLVASYTDAKAIARRDLIYVEHGAGQTYQADVRSAGHGAYSGGAGLDAVRLFIAPSEKVAARWRVTYPAASAVAVGCPRIDRYHRSPAPNGPTIAVTFHHQGGLVPENTWAMPHYRRALAASVAAWRAAGFAVVGTGHPSAESALRRLWGAIRVPWATTDEVFRDGSVLVADNTSLAFEFMAATDRPVLWLDAPWYRRDVDHGLRFWTEADSGLRIGDPADLAEAALAAFADPPEIAARRRATAARVYANVDGRAAERAAAAIGAHIGATS